MLYQTVKEGFECFFMTKKGCQFNGGSCHQIVENCEGCQRVKEFPTGKYCITFPEPAVKWRAGICNMATHMKNNKKDNGNGNGKINPLKASKRGIR